MQEAWDENAGDPALKKLVRRREHGVSLIGVHRIVLFLWNRVVSKQSAESGGAATLMCREVISTPSQKEVTDRARLALGTAEVAARIAGWVAAARPEAGRGVPLPRYSAFMKSLHASLAAFLPHTVLDDVVRYDCYKHGVRRHQRAAATASPMTPPASLSLSLSASGGCDGPVLPNALRQEAPAAAPALTIAPSHLDVDTFRRRVAEVAVLWTFEHAPSPEKLLEFFDTVEDQTLATFARLAAADGVDEDAVPSVTPTLPALVHSEITAQVPGVTPRGPLGAVAPPRWLEVNQRSVASPNGQHVLYTPRRPRAPCDVGTPRADPAVCHGTPRVAMPPVGSPRDVRPLDVKALENYAVAADGCDGALPPQLPHQPLKGATMLRYTRPRPQKFACNTLKGRRPHQYQLPVLVKEPSIPLTAVRDSTLGAAPRRAKTVAEQQPRYTVVETPPFLPGVPNPRLSRIPARRAGGGRDGRKAHGAPTSGGGQVVIDAPV
eukprot:TRINITY_DN4065_c0_g1_i1.p1 TRINITY_DN4065_c0_g1~~TRINITY_DN4065_c0_g1_i1.p1  ORF type:complete len:538 (+),score=163.15 TRINITY_DN4065_c0_g1_i1:138-1616(+)